MLYRLLKPLILLLSIIVLLLFSSSALAVGVGVTPGKMEFSLYPGGTQAQTLSVINPSDEESKFVVYVEGEHEEWFRITPGEFTLGPQETRAVEVAVSPPLSTFITTEHHDFSVCVVSLAPGEDLNLGAGARVAAHVQLRGFPYLWSWGSSLMAPQWWIVTAMLAIALVAAVIIRRRRRAYNV